MKEKLIDIMTRLDAGEISLIEAKKELDFKIPAENTLYEHAKREPFPIFRKWLKEYENKPIT